jgi:hypothetical protein
MIMLAGTLLAPAAALAQEPAGPPPAAVPVSSLPLPPVPEPETEADIAALVEPSFNVATVEEFAAVSPAAFLPLASKDAATIQADRMGFGTAQKLSNFPDIRSLYAGWYVNWTVKLKPERPANIEHMQMIRVYQELVDGCPRGYTADRTICPYKSPPSYQYSPSKAVIEAAAKANPGSVWLIGNEMDRVDGFGVYQDEMLPEIYAFAYHDLYTMVKKADPTARVAIGGMVLFTPAREEYLNKIWNTYKSVYGVNMPVDIWNVHNFVGSEYCVKELRNGRMERVCYGMGIPPGSSITPNAETKEIGSYVGEDWRHVYMPTFEQQIVNFRTWMKAHGQMNKPLIVTEYGVLYQTLCADYPTLEACKVAWAPNFVDLTDPGVVHGFMEATFKYFMNARNCNLSGVDDCRLVQRWAWYSLEDANWAFNPYTMLYTPGTNVRAVAGDKYAAFSAKNIDNLQYP